jgi:UDP-galactopyranose mutase
MRIEMPNYQGVAAINYTDNEVPHTRTIEHKHFENSQSDISWVSWEKPVQYVPEKTEPYYPVNDATNTEIYNKYKEAASKQTKVIFGGRLGEYKYYDMDKVIRSALDCAKKLVYMSVWHPNS